MALAAVIVFLSFRLKPDHGRPEVKIDAAGVVLAAASILLITFGFNNLNGWGLLLGTPAAPFNLLGALARPDHDRRRYRPRPGLLRLDPPARSRWQDPAARPLRHRFPARARRGLRHVRRRRPRGDAELLRAALHPDHPGPLARDTTIAMLPFNLTVFFAAMLVVRFYDRFTPRQIGRIGFSLCTVALLWLAFVVMNDWSSIPVLIGLVIFGIGQGALVTLLFNVLVTASPKELAGDVGSLRGTTNNLANAVGTATAGALLVGLLQRRRTLPARRQHHPAGRIPRPGRSQPDQLHQQ